MRKLLNNPYIVAALSLTAIGLIVHQTMGGRGASLQSYSESVAAEELIVDETMDGAVAPIALLDPFVLPEGLRDPFLAPRKPVAAAPAPDAELAPPERFHVSAVWMQGETHLVVINNRIYRTGESTSFVRVETVTREGVWVTHAEGRDFIAVGRQLLVQPPRAGSAPTVLLAARES